MAALLGGTSVNCTLASPLARIASDGFAIDDGCYVFRGVSKVTTPTMSSFPDRTGYEAFVNSFHVEDYDSVSPVAQAILFVTEVFRHWNARESVATLVAILSADEFSVVARFHLRRDGERWLSDNIEGYEDPVMSVDSKENFQSLMRSLLRN
ncbi:hypothetical protein [Paraburkholderia ferrariae]|uniref:hypothetical protein n=1 Tax=Paraburkholderia ferrariae TaxID=386056 RepID=UPI001FE04147|nr:hypothetical protein [Paraburkholderia ferrariae]